MCCLSAATGIGGPINLQEKRSEVVGVPQDFRGLFLAQAQKPEKSGREQGERQREERYDQQVKVLVGYVWDG